MAFQEDVFRDNVTRKRGRCDMFGFGNKKKAAQDKALQALDGTVGAGLMNAPKPTPEFWREPYVLGLIFGISGAIATLANLGTQDKGDVIHECLRQMSGEKGLELPRLMAQLMDSRESAFVNASERGARLMVMIEKRQVIGEDSDIMVARGMALADPHSPPNDAQAVLEHLTVMWVVQPVGVLARANGLI